MSRSGEWYRTRELINEFAARGLQVVVDTGHTLDWYGMESVVRSRLATDHSLFYGFRVNTRNDECVHINEVNRRLQEFLEDFLSWK
ncbi:hypothetical protein Q19_09 [Pectobacterium phage Q19]|uniref:Uncharacterized protein n=1 Tax=Pectobacterium phage Q19 TaxID=2500576 RepID=A0A678ZXM1_9CAUD|nr:hypothetical protein Q19_09 [Pectobacterium phage Q19]